MPCSAEPPDAGKVPLLQPCAFLRCLLDVDPALSLLGADAAQGLVECVLLVVDRLDEGDGGLSRVRGYRWTKR
jgi:hypothetical protein